MFDQSPTYHFESDIDTQEHVLLETRVVDLSTVTIGQNEGGLLVVTRNAEPQPDDDDDEPEAAPQLKYRLEPEGDLFRIVALRPIDCFYVNAGDRGGLVSSSHSLSQQGDCWIGSGSQVVGNAGIISNAYVHGGSVLTGNARVEASADVCNSTLDGNVYVLGEASVSDSTLSTERFSSLCMRGAAKVDESRIHIAGGQSLHFAGGCVRKAHVRNRFEWVSIFAGQRFGWLDVFRGVNGDQRFAIGCQDYDNADDLRSLGRDYNLTDVEEQMLEAFIALAAAAKRGWESDGAVTPFKSGDTAVAPATGGLVTSAVLSQYGEDLGPSTMVF